MYSYFISYVIVPGADSNEGTGYGSCGIGLKKRITTYKDIEEVMKIIEKDTGHKNIIIRSFQRFEEE